MSQEQLNRMKTNELAERARKAGIKGIENMNKQQMIDAISGGRGGGEHAPAPAGSKPQDWKNIPGNQS
jgi:hypothetical protein